MGFFDKFATLFHKKPEPEITGFSVPEDENRERISHGTASDNGAGKGFTINLNQTGEAGNVPEFLSFENFVPGDPPKWPEPKMPEVSEEENPEFLTHNMGLGAHHVNGDHIHIGMSVSYVADTHTVVYSHWSSQDPEKKETYPIPPEVRTKAQLLWYLERKTDIPSVCWHPYY